MGSSILSEGCQHLDSQDGALQRYHYSLNRLPASRLLLPRSGLERSDFVLWPFATKIHVAWHVRDLGKSGLVVLSESVSRFDPSTTSSDKFWVMHNRHGP